MIRDTSDPGSPYRYRHFGAFRFVLASLVMLQHFGADLAPEPLMSALAPYRMGDMAVLAFFALSGFVITNAVDVAYRGRPVAFLGNRLLRILPHFILAVMLAMVAHALFTLAGGERLWRSQASYPASAFDLSNVVLNFFGIIPLVDRAIDYNFLDITWAVRIEMAFYIIVAACIAVARVLPGGRLPHAGGFAMVATCALVLLAPLFVAAIYGRGIGMFSFVPYFAFGAALYFASAGRRMAWPVVLVSLAAMLWHCIAQEQSRAATEFETLYLSGDLVILVGLLSVMTVLAFSRIPLGRRADEALGAVTYPLYLYHEDVLVVVLTLTVGYSYSTFIAGMVLSLVAAIALSTVVDPLVNYYRDLVRGGPLRRSEATVAASETSLSPVG
jgi:peptidoglycan/LPS O-acetylase OafA/YrhL